VGDFYFGKVEERWQSSTATTTTGGLTLTKAAPSDALDYYAVTSIQASGDAAAVVSLESPSGTTIWRKRFSAAFTMSETFPPGTVIGAAGQAVLGKVSANTTNAEINVQGYRT
jgi:hypothetical protein